MIEKLPVGRSLRSEFSLVHGEIAELDAVAPANPFDFGSAHQEFGSRRIHDARDAHVDAAIERGDLPEISQARRDELRGASMETQAALDHGWRTGEGFDQRVISEMPPELIAVLRNDPVAVAPSVGSAVTSAPSLGL